MNGAATKDKSRNLTPKGVGSEGYAFADETIIGTTQNNMIKEYEFFEKLYALVNRLTDENLARMLEQTNDLLDHIVESKYYKEIEADIISGEINLNGIVEIAKLVPTLSKHDVNLIIWVTGFRMASLTNDSDYMLFQSMTYIASQKTNKFRIEDNKLRLVLTFMHLQALRLIIETERETE